jgi:ribosomal protein L29
LFHPSWDHVKKRRDAVLRSLSELRACRATGHMEKNPQDNDEHRKYLEKEQKKIEALITM